MLQEGLPYTIINQASPSALSLLGLRDPLIVGLEPNGRDDQKWIATREESGAFIIKNVANGKFLGVEGEPRDRAKIIVADSPTLWRIEAPPGPPGFYWIFLKDSELTVGLNLFLPIYPPPAVLQDGERQIWKISQA